MGGMSGAQPKACQLLGFIGVVAEVSEEAAKKRHEQGWCQELIYDLTKLIERIRECRKNKITTSIGYVGNVVDVWLVNCVVNKFVCINLIYLGNV
jgi:urocanate hydratase